MSLISDLRLTQWTTEDYHSDTALHRNHEDIHRRSAEHTNLRSDRQESRELEKEKKTSARSSEYTHKLI